jgi:hypothetical protein
MDPFRFHALPHHADPQVAFWIMRDHPRFPKRFGFWVKMNPLREFAACSPGGISHFT